MLSLGANGLWGAFLGRYRRGVSVWAESRCRCVQRLPDARPVLPDLQVLRIVLRPDAVRLIASNGSLAKRSKREEGAQSSRHHCGPALRRVTRCRGQSHYWADLDLHGVLFCRASERFKVIAMGGARLKHRRALLCRFWLEMTMDEDDTPATETAARSALPNALSPASGKLAGDESPSAQCHLIAASGESRPASGGRATRPAERRPSSERGRYRSSRGSRLRQHPSPPA